MMRFVLVVVLLVLNRAIEAYYYLRLPIAFFHSSSEQVAEASRQPEMPERGASELGMKGVFVPLSSSF